MMANNGTRTELPEGVRVDNDRTVAKLGVVQKYAKNPRSDEEMKPSDIGYRRLRESIEENGVTTPIQVFIGTDVFPPKNKLHLIAGHRRLAVCKDLEVEEIPVLIQKAPVSHYKRMSEMWHAEELKTHWKPYQKFNFFYSAITHLRNDEIEIPDQKQLHKDFAIGRSTISEYMNFMKTDTLTNAMKAEKLVTQEGEIDPCFIDHQGRQKALRAIYRISTDLIEYRPTVVNKVIKNAKDEQDKLEELQKLLLKKWRTYSRDHRLAVGPAVALERTGPLVSLEHKENVHNDDFTGWLEVENEADASRSKDDKRTILCSHVIMGRSSLVESLGKGNADELLQAVDDLGKQSLGKLSDVELQLHIDRVQLLQDQLTEQGIKARTLLRKRVDE